MNDNLFKEESNNLNYIEIANFFILSSLKDNIKINKNDLNNLIYFANGIFLFNEDNSLIKEKFKLNNNGRIELFELYESFEEEENYINKPKIKIAFLDLIMFLGYIPIPLNQPINLYLNGVWDLFKKINNNTFNLLMEFENKKINNMINVDENKEYVVISNDLIKSTFQMKH